MSKQVNNLSSELRGIFGESFGSNEKPKDLSESIDAALTERRRGLTPKGKKPQARQERLASSVPKGKAPKKGKAVNRIAAPDVKAANAKKSMDDFHAYADKEGEKSAARPKHKPLKGRDKTPWKGSESSGSGEHNPFKHAANLGTGPGTPPGFKGTGSRHHDQDKCWNCKCGNIYTKGCQCIGTGATKDCPKGHVKHVGIKHDYRQAYNKMYHKWRSRKKAEGDGVTSRIAKRGSKGAR